MKIKEWFLEKEFTQNERYIISLEEMSIERETEKAYLLKWNSDFGYFTRWVPKSCIYSNEELIKVYHKKEQAFNYYEMLVNYAKENGVKGVRIGLKAKTLIEKIKKAGLEVPVRG